MHETFIARDIIKEAEKHGNVREITVEVGELAHLPGHSLQETIKKMTGWKVEIINRAANVACSCGYSGRPEILHKTHTSAIFFCPSCSSVPNVIKGADIKLIEVKVKK